MKSNVDSSFRFISEDFLLFDNIQDMDLQSVNDEWIIILQCERGRFNVEFNGKHHSLAPNDLLLCSPKTIVEQSMMSPDFRGRAIGISERLCKEIFPNSAKIWRQAFYMRQQCKVSLPEKLIADLNIDWEYLKCRIVERDNEYYMDMMRCLIQSLLYRISHMLDELIGRIEAPETMQSRDVLTNVFFDLLASTTPKPRTVTWYADKLNKTPKYLSTVVKQTSGRPAFEWIQEAVTTEIANYLKNSSLTIKEICNELDFPSLSFFGRYVHEHLGVSPTEYRKQKRSQLLQ